MSRVHVEVSAVIHTRPTEVYDVLADYREEHPHILPKMYFTRVQTLTNSTS
jgi:hypothetical protein